jgi:transposase-like protein
MKLPTMAKVLRELLETSPGHQLSLEEKNGFIVDRECTDRDTRRLKRRIREAKVGIAPFLWTQLVNSKENGECPPRSRRQHQRKRGHPRVQASATRPNFGERPCACSRQERASHRSARSSASGAERGESILSENERLRKEVKALRMDLDIAKKAAAFFVRHGA